MKLLRLNKSILILVFFFSMPFVSNGQLSSEHYQVVGQAIGGTHTSINATSVSYAVLQESGGQYIYGDAIVTVNTNSNFGTLLRSSSSDVSLNTGRIKMYIPYSDIANGVLDASGTVRLCHAVTATEFVPVDQNIFAFVVLHRYVGDPVLQGHHGDTNDIIPPFYYDIGDGLFLYSGKNWTPSHKNVLENNCTPINVVSVGMHKPRDIQTVTDPIRKVEEKITSLVYSPYTSQNDVVTLTAGVGSQSVVSLEIQPGTFTIPSGVHQEEYKIFIQVSQAKAEISRQVTESITSNIVTLTTDAPVDFSKISSVGPLLQIVFLDSENNIVQHVEKDIGVKYFAPGSNFLGGEILSFQTNTQGIQWEQLSTTQSNKTIDFNVNRPGIISLWNVPMVQSKTLIQSDTKHVGQSVPLRGVVVLMILLILLLLCAFGYIALLHVYKKQQMFPKKYYDYILLLSFSIILVICGFLLFQTIIVH